MYCIKAWNEKEGEILRKYSKAALSKHRYMLAGLIGGPNEWQ